MGRKLKDQVLALGGDERDLELLKDVEKGSHDGASQPVDPNLTKDVSNFLKELQLGDKQSTKKGSKTSPKKKEGKKSNTPAKGQDVSKPDAPATDKPVKKVKSKPQEPHEDTKNGKGKQKADQGRRDKRKFDANNNPSKLSVDLPKPTNTKIVFEPSLIPSKPTPSLSSSDSLPQIPSTPHWYTLAPPLAPVSTPLPQPTPTQVAALTSRASALFASLPAAPSLSGSSDTAFLQKILSSGTLADKLSALTLLVQGSPLHNLKALEMLKGIAAKSGGRDERLKACRAIVDWWVGGGAPDRKLKYFLDQPLLHPDITPTHLLLFHFEDLLKKFFFSFLQLLEALTLDPLPYPRLQALTFVFTLLRDKPEQEQNLLRVLVNKLGDPTKQVPSRASYYLLQLLNTHPAMKAIVVREISSLVFRPASSSQASSSTTTSNNTHIRFGDKEKSANTKPVQDLNMQALYYGAITLNQVVLSHSDQDRAVARQLVDVYFKVFEGIVGRADNEAVAEEHEDKGKGEEGGEDKKGKGKFEGKGKGKDKGKGKGGKEKEVGFAEVEDANSKLVSQVLTGVNRALPYAHLGLSDVSFTTHIDTLFRITHTATFSTSLQALTLLLQITTSFFSTPSTAASTSASSTATLAASITARFYRTLYGTLLDPRLAGTSKHAAYLNLLLKALKLEKPQSGRGMKGREGGQEGERTKAIVRRMVQVLLAGGVSANSEVVVGGLWVLGELFSTVPGLRAMFNEPPKSKEEEYDPRKRDPQYAHASATPMWEIVPMLNYYHPTISLHARQLLHSQPITSSPDLSMNSLGHFLDRFVYKNPKSSKKRKEGDEDEEEGGTGTGKGSVMQPAAADGTGVRKLKGKGEEEAVREEGWWRRGVERVPVDQVFFHKYFNEKDKKEKQRATKKAKRKGGAEGEDDEMESGEEGEEEGRMESDEDDSGSEDGEEEGEDRDQDAEPHSDSDTNEAEIWKAMKASMKNMDDMADLDLMDDSEDEVPSGMDDDDDELLSGVDGEDSDRTSQGEEDEAEEEEEDTFSLAEASDAEDLIDLNADVPDGLIPYDGSDNESDAKEWGGISGGASSKKRKGKGSDEGRRRKKLKSLPTFASYDDYKNMIEEGPEDNI